MTPWNKFRRLTFFSLFYFLIITSITGQDLFDLENSKKFSKYLFETRQYNFASEELERVIYLEPNDTTSWLLLISSYRLANRHDYGIGRLKVFYPDLNTMPVDFTKEYLHLLYFKKEFQKADSFLLRYDGFHLVDKHSYRSNFKMLQNRWQESKDELFATKNSDNAYYNKLVILTLAHDDLNYKSPVTAGIMSGIIPGSGKFYTKNWQDGIIAFLFVSVNAWQAYRGFNKYGKKSAYGWIFGTLSAGFYISNIFGSVKAAKKYNKKLNDELYYKSANTLVDNL